MDNDNPIPAPAASDISRAELTLQRATQRYASSKAACMEMFESLSILVVPQSSFKVLANASWDVKVALDRLGNVQARRRAYLAAA